MQVLWFIVCLSLLIDINLQKNSFSFFVFLLYVLFMALTPTHLSLSQSRVECFTENVLSQCDGPGVVQRKGRQKKEFHDQSDYR